MQYFIFLLICGQISAADGRDGKIQNAQFDEIVHRQRNFAVCRIEDIDPWVASAALDALATLDGDQYRDKLREKLNMPVTDPSLEVALKHLIKHAKLDDLKHARKIVQKAAKKGDEERKTDPFLVDAASIEFLALEVLLTSSEPKEVEFATRYIEKIIERNPGPGITQMDLALDLIGRYAVKSAADKIRADIINEELQVSVLSALAKNGQQSALKILKKRMETMEKVVPIISDSQLVDKLDVTVDELKAVYRKGDRKVQILTAGQLARKGHMKELHAVTQEVLAKPDIESTVLIEDMIGRYGDESFVHDLEEFASNASTTTGKLSALQSMFQIARRVKAAKRAKVVP